MLDMMLAIIPAALAGTAVLAFFWTVVMRIQELESRTTAMQSEMRSQQEQVTSQFVSLESARDGESGQLDVLAKRLEEYAARQSRAVEAVATMLGAMRSEIYEQEERMTALMDLRLTKAAQETSDEVRRIEAAVAGMKPGETQSAAASA
jgi:DNA anti-recombination protein RmuC